MGFVVRLKDHVILGHTATSCPLSSPYTKAPACTLYVSPSSIFGNHFLVLLISHVFPFLLIHAIEHICQVSLWNGASVNYQEAHQFLKRHDQRTMAQSAIRFCDCLHDYYPDRTCISFLIIRYLWVVDNKQQSQLQQRKLSSSQSPPLPIIAAHQFRTDREPLLQQFCPRRHYLQQSLVCQGYIYFPDELSVFPKHSHYLKVFVHLCGLAPIYPH